MPREIGLRLVTTSKSKYEALAKRIWSVTVRFTSLEQWKRKKMLVLEYGKQVIFNLDRYKCCYAVLYCVIQPES